MKKLITNHKFIRKIFLSIMIVVMLSFAVPVRSQASIGGLLLDPLFDLIGTVADVVCGALQAFLVDGQFNNSDDSSGLNFYLADADDFMKRTTEGSDEYDESYAEFKYNPNASVKKEFQVDELDKSIWGNSTYAIPMLRYTPEKIFSGRIPALDINFVNPTDWTQKTDENGNPLYGNADEMNQRSIAIALHETIASWYVSLRNLCIVGLMLVLLYVGIRIVISSTASDKSKYKQMLMDWLVALCIVFCLHYIMTFTTAIVNEISQTVAGNMEQNGNSIAVQVKDGDDVDAEFNTDLMGLIRFQMQYNTVGSKLLYLIFYIAMVIYTCMFTFYYLKRVLTMAFLTLISPLVALTYPIDKLRDGKAQAFDMWLKEYVFNALVQPFHLIIYSIFVGSAVNLAADNPLYAIIALAFITPAEKILRKFFGFEKAATAGALGTAASALGGAAAMNALRGVMSPKKSAGGNHVAGGKKPRQVEGDKPSMGDAFGGGAVSQPLESRNVSQAERNQQEDKTPQQRMLDAYDEGFGTDSYAPAEREAMAREAYQPEGMNYSADEYASILRDSGYEEDEIRQMMADDPRYAQTNTNPEIRSDNGTHQETVQTGSHGRASFSYSDNDGRGMGQWPSDGIRNSRPAQGGSSKFKAVQGSVRQFTNNNKAGRALTGKWIPKPIRNSIKGATGVIGRTGLAVGKAALKAAPGAIFGMAAGIAGDELSDIPKYTLAGAALSSSAGSSAVVQAGRFVKNAYRQSAHGNVEGQIEQRRREFEKDENNQLLAESMNPGASKGEVKQIMKKASYYDSIGIEGKDAFKAAKLQDKLREELKKQGKPEEESDNMAQKQAAVIADIAKDYSKKDLRDKDEVNNLRTDLTSKLGKAGLKGQERKETVEKIVSEVKAFRGVSNNY